MKPSTEHSHAADISLEPAEHGADEGKLNGDPETDGRPGEGSSFDQPA